MFPPQSGLTYSTWFCVDKFSTFGLDAHPVRLLTIVRNLQGREENLICLSVSIMSKDRALIVTTQENYMPNAGEDLYVPSPGWIFSPLSFFIPMKFEIPFY